MLLLFLYGCTSVTVTNFDEQARLPNNSGEFDVYVTPANITRPYRQIGLITVDDGEGVDWGTTNQSEMIQTAISRARQMGADAVILSVDSNQRVFGYGGMMNTAHQRVVNAVAVVYTDKE